MDKPVATLLTMIQVDEHDPAFDEPTKPIGPIYDQAAEELRGRGWTFKPDGRRSGGSCPRPSRGASSSCARSSGSSNRAAS